jgi:antitoxin component YwqK of YwqJK toxin-antitoxin module
MDPKIKEKLQLYKEKGYKFKSCQKEWIIVLGDTDNTKTKEVDDIIDKDNTTYAGNEFMVIDIVHKFSPGRTIDYMQHSYFKPVIIYEKGKNVHSNNFGEKMDHIGFYDLNYVINPETAFDIDTVTNGVSKGWYDNGQLAILEHYEDNKRHGKHTQWHYNGELFQECHYEDGCLNGKFIKWYKDSKFKELECYYKNSVKDGLYQTWYKSGNENNRHYYKNGNVHGPCLKWYDNGVLENISSYKNGELDGLHRQYYDNGNQDCEYHYEKGKRIGICTNWSKFDNKRTEFTYEDGTCIKTESIDELKK